MRLGESRRDRDVVPGRVTARDAAIQIELRREAPLSYGDGGDNYRQTECPRWTSGGRCGHSAAWRFQPAKRGCAESSSHAGADHPSFSQLAKAAQQLEHEKLL